MSPELPFAATFDDEVELVAVDLGLARAFWDGASAARLLARIRLDRDEHDAQAGDEGEPRAAGSTWERLAARLLAASPSSHDRVKRAVARHTRAASHEGPLRASDAAIAAIVHVLLSAPDPDASPSEGAAAALAIDPEVRRACGRLDDRLGNEAADRRAPAFEACLELVRLAGTPAMPVSLFTSVLDALVTSGGSAGTGGADPSFVSVAPLYPWGDHDVSIRERRACLLEPSALEQVLLRDKRDVAAAIARAESKLPGAPVAKLARETALVLAKRGALLFSAVAEPMSVREAEAVPPSSWLPSDFGTPEAARLLAGALERGATTAPRARSVVARGGYPALDAIGAEMLHMNAHPFASAVFAEILATMGRERDVVRLVTYFAIAPDPAPAARALAMCRAREVKAVLVAWLESMLPPASGGPAEGAPGTITLPQTPGFAFDPKASPAARLVSCVTALQPYPELYAAVRPLLERAR